MKLSQKFPSSPSSTSFMFSLFSLSIAEFLPQFPNATCKTCSTLPPLSLYWQHHFSSTLLSYTSSFFFSFSSGMHMLKDPLNYRILHLYYDFWRWFDISKISNLAGILRNKYRRRKSLDFIFLIVFSLESWQIWTKIHLVLLMEKQHFYVFVNGQEK